jgi:hypothetical protein
MFEAHGSFDIQISGHIMVVDIKGCWNVETALEYKIAIEKIIQPLIGKHWAILSIMDDWELFTPDCKPVIMKLSHDALINGLQREAMVDHNNGVKMQHFPTSIVAFPWFKRQFFTSTGQAYEWLKAEGFEP